MFDFLSILYPRRCPYCAKVIKAGGIACEKCMPQLDVESLRGYAMGYELCAPFLYDGIFAEAVKRFKFSQKPDYAASFAESIAKCVKDNFEEHFDYVTCVPMHKSSEAQCGYNQSQLLAKRVSKLLGVPYGDFLVQPERKLPQHECDTVAKRRKNVRGIYKPKNTEKFSGKTILLIDDIKTTGYTLGECCKTLKRAGAGKIKCAVICVKKDY